MLTMDYMCKPQPLFWLYSPPASKWQSEKKKALHLTHFLLIIIIIKYYIYILSVPFMNIQGEK